MKTIFKYPFRLDDDGVAKVSMPTGAKILKVAEQRGTICAWALVDTGDHMVRTRTFYIVGTGQEIRQQETFGRDAVLQYMDTFLMLDGDFVWHVFEVV